MRRRHHVVHTRRAGTLNGRLGLNLPVERLQLTSMLLHFESCGHGFADYFGLFGQIIIFHEQLIIPDGLKVPVGLAQAISRLLNIDTTTLNASLMEQIESELVLCARQVPVQHATQQVVLFGRQTQDPVVKAHLIVQILLRFHKDPEKLVLKQKVRALQRLNQAFLHVNRAKKANVLFAAQIYLLLGGIQWPIVLLINALWHRAHLVKHANLLVADLR